MYLLDTSIVSNYLDKRRNFPLLTNQILNTSPELIFISIITVEEIIQGALATLQKLRQKSAVTDAKNNCVFISYIVQNTSLTMFIAAAGGRFIKKRFFDQMRGTSRLYSIQIRRK